MNNHSSVPPALFEAKQFQIQTSSKSKKGTRVMTVLSRKTKTASLAMVAIAAFAIAAPQARADLPQGYEQLREAIRGTSMGCGGRGNQGLYHDGPGGCQFVAAEERCDGCRVGRHLHRHHPQRAGNALRLIRQTVNTLSTWREALDDYRPAAAAAKELVDDEPQAPFSPGEFVQV